MRKEHDERAKLIAEQALDCLGEVAREVEIPTADAPRIDLWLRRLYFPSHLPAYLQLLSAMFPEDSMIEAFSEAVRLLSFYECHHKQYEWRRHLDQQRREKATEGEELPLLHPPLLWIFSAGRPDALFEARELVPWPGFPEGVYEVRGGWRIGLLVISELPPGPQTLLLRLMGSPAVRRKALVELRQMPAEDPDAQALREIVATLRHTFARATNISQQERDEFMTAARAEFENYTQQIRKEGRKEGQQAMVAALLDLCEVLAIPVGEAQREQLSAMDLPALQALFKAVKTRRAWPE